MKIFMCIWDRTTDSDGKDLADFKREVGSEMIGYLNIENKIVVSVSCPTTYGTFEFRDLKEGELSPYASLDELFGVKIKDGRFSVGS